MLTTLVKGSLQYCPVGGIPGALISELLAYVLKADVCDIQPIDHSVVRELEHKLINDPIDSYRSAHENECSIIRIVKDEVVPVKVSQAFTTNASGHGGNVVHVSKRIALSKDS